MATAIQLEPATIEALDAMVSRGRFSSRDEAIRMALMIVEDADAASLEELDDGTLAMLEQRIAEADAEDGEGYAIEEVFDALERRSREDLARHGQAAA